MRFILSLLVAFTVGLGVLTACQNAAPTQKVEATKTTGNPTTTAGETAHVADDDAPRITLADAKADFDAGRAVFVDTRSADAHKLERVKGALNVSLDDFEARYKEIPTNKKIIVYCS